jgi:OHCU decarboxylase
MAVAGDVLWSALPPSDWLEAFAAHPRIGHAGAGRAGGADGSDGLGGAGWSDEEQAGVAVAAEAMLRRLAEANRDYEARFGYIFIVCATGKTAGEMLALLEARLRHDPGEELRIAAEEQRQITRLRLNKLIEQQPETNV